MFLIYNALKEDVEIHDYFGWPDSMICLAWIKSIPTKNPKSFVENRLIRSQVSPERWRHCKSADNPADVITRFECNSNKHELFYNGPFLLRNCAENHSKLDNELLNDDFLPSDYCEEQKSTLLTRCGNSIVLASCQSNY